MDEDDIKELREKFRIVCRKCGSEDVVVNIEEGTDYSECTRGGGSIQIGCNACKANDWYGFYD